MNYDIKELERKLNININKNILSFGIDIAQRISGWCIIYTDNKILTVQETGIIDTSQMESVEDRLDLLENELNKINIKDYKIRVGVIEDCFFGRNVWTLKTLARSSAIAYIIMKKKLDDCYFLTPISARARIGIPKPNCKKEEVLKFIKNNFKFKKDENIADAFVLALAGISEKRKKNK